MAGIQIDGVNNKIDFDDDLDTSISANTDDTLVIEAGGNTMATITATTFTINDGTTITTADNTDTLTLTSTDADASSGPNLRLYRNSGSPADGDDLSTIDFEGRNDNSQDVVYAQIKGLITDASDGTEDGKLELYHMLGGSLAPSLQLTTAGIVINESSNDIDFRVESNGNANMLFVDGGNNRVNMGSATDVEATLVVSAGDSGVTTPDANGNLFVIEKNDNCGMSILSSTDGGGYIHFGDSDDIDIGVIEYSHPDNSLRFTVNAAERMRIITNKVGFGTATPQAGIDIERDDTVIRGTNSSSTANYQNMRLFSAVGGTGTETFRIENDGDVKNTNNSYGSISDERIKQNITDAGSQWDDIKALKIRNYKRKDQVAAGLDITMIGVIAQELETAGMNGLVKESPPGTGEIRANSVFGTIEELKTYYTSTDIEVEKGTKSVGDVKQTAYKENPSDVLVKGVKYSVLYMKAIKALQEAQTRIETLETKVTALEG